MPSSQLYLDRLNEYLTTQYANKRGLWNYSSNNTLGDGWLFATPSNVFGTPYADFKQPVAGDYPLFMLSSKNADGSTQQSVAVRATVTKPADQPVKLLEGHSFGIYDEMYSVMVSARMFLDVTTLTPPTGRFLAAIINALTYISNKPEDQRPIIRILYSNWLANAATFPPDLLIDAAAFLKTILANVDPARKLTVYAGAINAGFEKGITAWAFSWNHSKIVAADGQAAIVGGHNMWSEHYLGKNPVFDVSMKIQGESACHAQDYADKLWRYVLWRMNDSLLDKAEQASGLVPLVHTAAYTYDAVSGVCTVKESYTAQTVTTPQGTHVSFVPNSAGQPDKEIYTRAKGAFPRQTGSVPILSIGREAGMDLSHVFPDQHSYLSEEGEPADQSMYQLFAMAQNRIRMSLQSFSVSPFSWLNAYEWYMYTWDYRLFVEMAKAVRRGVTIEVVLSNPDAIAGGLKKSEAPYNGEYVENVNRRLRDVLIRQFYMAPIEAEALVAQKFFATNFRFSPDDTYPDGAQSVPLPNHAKTFMIDDRLFYIGSQNQYRCNLAEFGYVVEDAASAQSYIDNYWTKLWTQAKRTLHPTFNGSLERFQNAEGTIFILDLLDNQRLNKTWQKAIKDYLDAPADAKAPYLATLNDIIANAGYQTTADVVIELTRTPFFTNERPSNEPNAESDRFVRDLMTKKDLAADFAALIDSIDSGDSDKAVNQFLQQKGYGCNVLQVYASFDAIRGSNLNYFAGEYVGVVIQDGGEAFDFRSQAERAREPASGRLAAAEPNADQIQKGPVLLIESDQSVKLDGVALVNPTYTDNVLNWKQADGNATGGSITFSEIPRSGLKDPFAGVECFGEITYPDTGTPPLKGTISFYARKQTANTGPNQPDQPVRAPSDWPIIVFTLLGLALLGAAGAYFTRDRWNRRDDGRGRYSPVVQEHEPENGAAFEMRERYIDRSSGESELRKRRTGNRLNEANSNHRGSWGSDVNDGLIQQDVNHYVAEEGKNVESNNLLANFERQFADLVDQSMTDDDFAKDSDQVVKEILNEDFRKLVRDNLINSFRDQIEQRITDSMVKRIGSDAFKQHEEDIGGYLDASIAIELAGPMERRMETQSSPDRKTYLENRLRVEIAARKADYLKNPDNKSALQIEVGSRLNSVIASQEKTAGEKTEAINALTQAEIDLQRTPSKEAQDRVDALKGELEEIAQREEKLNEERREAEAGRDELDPDKLEEKRKEANEEANRERREVFRPFI